MNRLRRLWHPELFHGAGKNAGFFEGWYFKVVDPTESQAWAFIPGVSLAAPDAKVPSHAFVQVLDGRACSATYHRYPLEAFHADPQRFEVRVGDNLFSRERIALSIDDMGQRVRGELSFEGMNPWPATTLSPGIMGPYSFTPFMQCYHGVLSLDHGIRGTLAIGDRPIDFTGGRGYIEKDWGRAFPKAWIWAQSNHFERPGISLIASIATIPWLTGEFTGYIVGFLCDGRLFRFTTYNGAKVERVAIEADTVALTIMTREHVLELVGQRAEGGELISPLPNGMEGRIKESLSAQMSVTLRRRRADKGIVVQG
jgi:hypothetical protein